MDDGMLTVELRNTHPVDLIDLATSFSALAQSFQEYASDATGDPLPGNLRLYVREIKSGSIIAELAALAEQAQWVEKHVEVLAGFVANLNDLIAYFLGRRDEAKGAPSQKEADQVSRILDPVARDLGSQLNIQVTSRRDAKVETHYHFHINSRDANAAQNQIKAFLGPQLPASQVFTGQLMVLDQVRNSAKAKTGDRGMIETISKRPIKLQFSSDEVKRAIIDIEDNPLQCTFEVDVEVRSVQGVPKLYRILEVKDVIRD